MGIMCCKVRKESRISSFIEKALSIGLQSQAKKRENIELLAGRAEGSEAKSKLGERTETQPSKERLN